jgi:hypothetical protein
MNINEPIVIDVDKKHTPWKNQVKFTPQPKYKNLISALSDINEAPVANTLNYIVKDYFDRMPEQQRRRLIEHSKHHY